MAGQDDEPEIELRLRDYIRSNPGAGDTATGVVSFWLCIPPTRRNITMAERILARLEAEGLLRSRDLGGTTYWFVPGNV